MEKIVRLNSLILLAVGGMLMTAPAFAAETAQPQAQPAEQSKVICRKETETGSILKKRRVCYTKRQWEQAGQASRDSMTQGQMSGSSSGQ
jgi:hypothetical protein